MAATKKSTAKRPTAKKTTAAKRAPAKPQATAKATKKQAPTTKPAAKATGAEAKAGGAAKRGSTTRSSTNRVSASSRTGTATRQGKTAAAPAQQAGGSSPAADTSNGLEIPAPRGTTKDGIAYTKDFDVKFLKAQHDVLVAERSALLGQASRLEDEANSLIEDGEMGDVQFDDESGEGDTMVVERERDLALSAQARQTIADIDAALTRMSAGTYGYSLASGRPIPRERLEAIPWATVLVEEKVGGIGRR